jgi:hypothetical protein
MLRALHAGADQAVANPAGAIALGDGVQFAGSDFRRIAGAAEGLAAQGLREFRALGALFDALHHFAERGNFFFCVEIGMAARIVVGAKLFVDAAIAHADDVAGGEMHQAGVVALAEKIEEIAGGIDIGGERVTQVGIKIGEAGAVGDHV